MKIILYFLVSESAATSIEYALVAGIIGLVIVGAATSIGPSLSSQFAKVAGNLS